MEGGEFDVLKKAKNQFICNNMKKMFYHMRGPLALHIKVQTLAYNLYYCLDTNS